MKIILSRKGFDSSYGGVPSPILPEGRLLSLPIPSPGSPIRYRELTMAGYAVGRLVETLTNGRLGAVHSAHLDPDLRAEAYSRAPGWRPLFGQDGAAQGHLANQGVGSGDLFLFFGWFRQVERVADHYRFVRGAPDLHVLYGWLQVDTVWALETRPAVPNWARYHPHVHRDAEANNVIYVARKTLSLGGCVDRAPGAGVFTHYHERLRLTAPGRSRSIWRLPRWFYPVEGREPLSYHTNPDRWARGDAHTLLRSVPRGQEFVLDADQYPEALSWARTLVAEYGV
jgi:hypothetical protein